MIKRELLSNMVIYRRKNSIIVISYIQLLLVSCKVSDNYKLTSVKAEIRFFPPFLSAGLDFSNSHRSFDRSKDRWLKFVVHSKFVSP